jgi:hypothetical protein
MFRFLFIAMLTITLTACENKTKADNKSIIEPQLKSLEKAKSVEQTLQQDQQNTQRQIDESEKK